MSQGYFYESSVLIMVKSLRTTDISKNQLAIGGNHLLYMKEQKKELDEISLISSSSYSINMWGR